MDRDMRLNERIGRRVKLQDLNVLLAVVQARSMSKAAEQVHTGQPSISRVIAHLEKVFGVPLLERYHEGVEPTDYGRALLDCGLAVFGDLRRGIENVEFLLNPDVGEVRVGCAHVLAAGFVAAVITRVSKRYPGMVFRLVTDYPDALHEELTARRVDLLIGRRIGKLLDNQLNFQYFFNDSYVVAADKSSP